MPLEAASPALLNVIKSLAQCVGLSSFFRSKEFESTSFSQLLMEGATIDAFIGNSSYIHVFCRQRASARCPKQSLAGAGGPWDMGLHIPFRALPTPHPPGHRFQLKQPHCLGGCAALMDWSQEEHGCLGHRVRYPTCWRWGCHLADDRSGILWVPLPVLRSR